MQIIPTPLNTGKMATGSSYLIIIILHKIIRKPRILWDQASRVHWVGPWWCPWKQRLQIRCSGSGMRGRDAGGLLPLGPLGRGWDGDVPAKQRTGTTVASASPPSVQSSIPTTAQAGFPFYSLHMMHECVYNIWKETQPQSLLFWV